mmetsp:Transcript_55274/g.177163  ORF Transcript_55274/g.177163 Transcript_55274/m.177163 type:complete len:312 (+) Transcript_55274:700-1635(+)
MHGGQHAVHRQPVRQQQTADDQRPRAAHLQPPRHRALGRLDQRAPVARARLGARARRVRLRRWLQQKQRPRRRLRAAGAQDGRQGQRAAAGRGGRGVDRWLHGRGLVGYRRQPRRRLPVPALPEVGAAHRGVLRADAPEVLGQRAVAAPGQRHARGGPGDAGLRGHPAHWLPVDQEPRARVRRHQRRLPGEGLRAAAVPAARGLRQVLLGLREQAERPHAAGDRGPPGGACGPPARGLRPGLALGLRADATNLVLLCRRRRPSGRCDLRVSLAARGEARSLLPRAIGPRGIARRETLRGPSRRLESFDLAQ